MQLLATADGGTSWAVQALPSFLPIADGLRATNATTLLLIGTTATEVPEIARSSTGGSTWGKALYFDPAWVSETPTSGTSGSAVTLRGHGCDNGEAVSIRWAAPTGMQVALTTADSNGSFAVPFPVPAATAGTYRVYA